MIINLMATVAASLNTAQGKMIWRMLCIKMATADVSSAFLYAELEEELYVQFPDKTYARLLKYLYGLKQAAKCFEEVLREGPTECAEEPRKSPT